MVKEDFTNEFACYAWGWIMDDIKTWEKIYDNYHKLKDGVNVEWKSFAVNSIN